MKSIITFLLGISISASAVYAYTNIPIRTLIINTGAYDESIYKFVDPDNGNVCYVMYVRGNYSRSISCLKNK